MTLSTRIAPHLPFLRRYSRALTGTQTSGDAYVAAVLEAIIADLTIFPDTPNDRVAVYKLFTKLFGSSAVQIPSRLHPMPGSSVPRRISRRFLRSPARPSFLLPSKISRLGEIADILDVPETEAMQLPRQGVAGNFAPGRNGYHDHRG